MKVYGHEAFEKLIHVVRTDDKDARQWLVENGYEELPQFWDAIEGVEQSFRWLFENNYKQLAAVIDAFDGNDKAKLFLLASGNRELAAFVEAVQGSGKALTWLIKFKHHGWALLAKEIFDKDNKKEKKGFFHALFNMGNPFR